MSDTGNLTVNILGSGGDSAIITTNMVESSSVTANVVTGARGEKGDKGDTGTTDYNELVNLPTLGTAAAKDIPAIGNASATEVVYGTDTRLTDSRPASDVSAWAKAPTKPTYTKSEVGLSNVDNTSDANKPISIATQAALDTKASTTALTAHTSSTANPHNVTKEQVGLGATDNVQFKQITSGTTTDVLGTAISVLRNNVAVGRIDNNASGLRVQAQSGTLQLRGTGNTGLAIDASGNTVGAGTITATNLSGTNTGDQPLGSRTITGTANQITVTNGDGVSGNPTLSLPNAITLPGTLTITGHTSPQADSTYTLGTSSLYWKETYTDKLFLNSTATLDGSTAGEIKGTGIFTADNIKRGTGSPEGVVTATVGTEYVDTAATNGAVKWIKATGSGNTGWRVIYGDTGWRQMKADWNVSPRSSGNGFVERLLIRRVGNRITLACYLEAAFGGGKNHSVAAFLPVGFRNTSSLGVWPEVNRFRLTSSQTTWVDPILETGTAGNLRIITPSPTHEAYSEIAWVTDNQWPTTLPGVSA